jgi:hypothetical protein
MPILTPNNKVLNPLSPNGFQLTIQKIPEMIYFSQSVNIPGINLPHISFNNMFSAIPIASTNIQFDTLNIDFLVDESMSNYLSIYNWIIAMGYPDNFQQYTAFLDSQAISNLTELAKSYSDGTIQILGSNNEIVRSITFIDLLPISISTVTFASTNNDVNYITASAVFNYNYFIIT